MTPKDQRMFFMLIAWQMYLATLRYVPSDFSGKGRRSGSVPVTLFGKILNDGEIREHSNILCPVYTHTHSIDVCTHSLVYRKCVTIYILYVNMANYYIIRLIRLNSCVWIY